MENTYIFIIWNKAFWQKKKIINDINNSFNIVKDIYIQWNKENFPKNLLAFYGRKLGEPKGKMISSGTKEFELVVVKDNNPNNEVKRTYDGDSIVNTNVFNSKQLYRSWTCGSHRVHSSDTVEETIHDLTILFGPHYKEKLNSFNDGDVVNLDTIGIEGFNDIDELKLSLQQYGNNIILEKDNDLIVFCKCRYDIVKFLNCKKENNENTYSLNIDNRDVKLYIFGELDNDLLNYTLSDMERIIVRNEILNDFDSFLNRKRKYKDVERKETFKNRWTVIKNEIKLIIKKLERIF